MPTYDYQCEKCNFEFEREQRITEDPIKTCPECKARKVKRLLSAPNFILKGGGWYADGYGSSGKKKSGTKDSSSSGSGSDGGGDSDGGGSGAKAKPKSEKSSTSSEKGSSSSGSGSGSSGGSKAKKSAA